MPKKVSAKSVNKYIHTPIYGKVEIDEWFNDLLKPLEEIKNIVIESNKPNYDGDFVDDIREIFIENDLYNKLMHISSSENKDRQDVFKNSSGKLLERYIDYSSTILNDDGLVCDNSDEIGFMVCIMCQFIKPSLKYYVSTIHQSYGGVKTAYKKKIKALQIMHKMEKLKLAGDRLNIATLMSLHSPNTTDFKESTEHFLCKLFIFDILSNLDRNGEPVEWNDIKWTPDKGVYSELPYCETDHPLYWEKSEWLKMAKDIDAMSVVEKYLPFDNAAIIKHKSAKRGKVLFVPDVTIHGKNHTIFVEIVKTSNISTTKENRMKHFFTKRDANHRFDLFVLYTKDIMKMAHINDKVEIMRHVTI